MVRVKTKVRTQFRFGSVMYWGWLATEINRSKYTDLIYLEKKLVCEC